MAEGEEKGGEGGVGELLPPSLGPLQHLSQGIPGELPQDRPNLQQPQLSLHPQEDKQEEDEEEEEESQHAEVQLSAPQLLREGCAHEGRALSLLSVVAWERKGSQWGHQVVISHSPKEGKGWLGLFPLTSHFCLF